MKSPIVVAELVKVDGIQRLLSAQIFGTDGRYMSEIVVPCTTAEIALQLILESMELANWFDVFELRTSDPQLFREALTDGQITVDIVHPSETSFVVDQVTGRADIFREFYPEPQPVEPPVEDVQPRCWRGLLIRVLTKLIEKIQTKGDMSNEI
ncbi:hypothetical protein [Paenibacillus sp. 453mf]|uniref:hypothetical protein n=1 Tax=Paenibacillus sp. 453mf TaxID=1761874 RepID=UPI0008EC0AD9|nr:hypothetical protein [Paenibacillus sp. 453mf]SFS76265.1 hypothetical protein SAMN04488601_10352 [Paenibacillus sp. 453mf]